MENIDRTKLVGASEVPAILGLDPFKTPLMLWSEKTGQVKLKDLSDNQAVEWGCRLERIVSKKFSEDHNVKIVAYKKRFIHPSMPFFSCELDNIIAGTDEIVEIKTVNAWAWKSWEKEDELPQKVICQVMAQMGLSNRKVAWVGCLCGGQRYIEKRVEFDPEFFSIIEDRVAEFWKMVQDKEVPMTMGADNDSILDLYPENDDQIQQVQEFEEQIALRQEVCMHIKELKDQKDEIDASIKHKIGDNLGLSTNKYIVKWSPQIKSTVDIDALKSDGLYDSYTKKSKYRVLRITKKKEK